MRADVKGMVGMMYLTLATFAEIWTTGYGMSVGVGGLNYFALGIGFTIGTQVRSSGCVLLCSIRF